MNWGIRLVQMFRLGIPCSRRRRIVGIQFQLGCLPCSNSGTFPACMTGTAFRPELGLQLCTFFFIGRDVLVIHHLAKQLASLLITQNLMQCVATKLNAAHVGPSDNDA